MAHFVGKIEYIFEINFYHHISNDHYIYSYIDYIIGLKMANPNECNATNSFALNKFKSKSIKWIPKFSILNIESYFKEKELLNSATNKFLDI